MHVQSVFGPVLDTVILKNFNMLNFGAIIQMTFTSLVFLTSKTYSHRCMYVFNVYVIGSWKVITLQTWSDFTVCVYAHI